LKITNPAPSFLPVDLVTYNLGVKPPGELQNTGGHISTEAAGMTHGFMHGFIGTDQSEYGSHITMKDWYLPSFIALLNI
jgi:hypothetical protein